MSYTKREFISAAFEEIGLAAYVFDLQAEQLQGALRKLDSLMASWYGRGINLGYPLPSSPSDSSLDTLTEVPDWANEGITTALAVRIAPGYGKTAPRETKVAAREALKTVLRRVGSLREVQYPSDVPLGAGNKPQLTELVFIPAPDTAPLQVDSPGDLEFL